MSDKSTAANRKNALKSTGPKTLAGKARSRINARKHGAYASLCSSAEDLSGFKTLLLDLLAEFTPIGVEETYIVNELAETIWRKNRYKFAEAHVLDGYSSYQDEEGNRTEGDWGIAMANDSGFYRTIPRCLTAEEVLDRRVWRLFDRLRKLQKKRGVRPVSHVIQEKHEVQDKRSQTDNPAS